MTRRWHIVQRLGRAFLRARRGNVAVTFALSLIPLTLAAGAGIDYARAMVVRAAMADALDAAALAVGASGVKPSACSSDGSDSGTTGNGSGSYPTPCAQMQKLAQQYFDANYKLDPNSYGQVDKVSITITDQSVKLSARDNMPVVLLSVMGLFSGQDMSHMPVSTASTVVWGQTKLWVALVLDNSGSMASSGKMTALQGAAKNFLQSLQKAAAKDGDVQVGIVPFTNDVNVGSGFCTGCIDWSNWSAQGSADIPDPAHGPGDSCPYSYGCRAPGTEKTRISTIPATGYICPLSRSDSHTDGTNGHYFMGCFTSVALSGQKTTVDTGRNASCSGYSSSNCKCNGSGKNTVCQTQKWSHPAWVAETDRTLWKGCITDRNDIQNTQPSGDATGFTADNSDNCPKATVTSLGYDWSSLSSQIDGMKPAGSTNQAIGMAHGWQMLTPGAPYGTPAVPANTSRYIILLSDGLNTQDRWYGNGSTERTSDDQKIDDRMNAICTAAKKDGVIVYTIYVNINNSDGDSQPLEDCASVTSDGTTHFYKLTDSAQIGQAFDDIAKQITNLRVAQ